MLIPCLLPAADIFSFPEPVRKKRFFKLLFVLSLGIQNPNNIQIIKAASSVPVIVDAGVGTASDAAIAMELGVDGVLMNTGIAGSDNPVEMAEAMKLSVKAGRLAYLAGRIPRKMYATASSPIDGVVGT